MKEIDKQNRKEEIKALKEILDKQIELEKIKQKKRTPIWKIIVLIFIGIATIAFLAFSCYMMFKQSFTMETLLTVLLSFFSIGLSIMFYIQSEKSSSSYYTKSYDIMKEVSVALGKIETGFGEKLSGLKEDIGKLEHRREEVRIQLDESEKETEKIRQQIITETKLSPQEKEKLINELQEKTQENIELRNRLDNMEEMRRREIARNRLMQRRLQYQENRINGLMKNKMVRNYIVNSAKSLFDEENNDL